MSPVPEFIVQNIFLLNNIDSSSTIPKGKKIKANPFFSHERISKMAAIRNHYLGYIAKKDWHADYIMVVDLDVAKICLDGILTCFSPNAPDWDAVTAFGYSTSGNGCDYGNVLAQRDDWVEITDSVQTLEDFQNLPAGAIVSWSPYNTTSLGNTYGHVYIADGQGHGISDFKEDITSYYMDRDSEWRVFLPT